MTGFLGTDVPVAITAGEAPANLSFCSGENAPVGGGTSDHRFNQESQEANQGIVKKQYAIDKHGGGPTKRYARSDLEELRHLCVEEQKRRWKEVYEGLESVIKDEYDLLGAPPAKSNQKQQKRKPKKETSAASDKTSAECTPVYLDRQDLSGHVWANSSFGEDSMTPTEDPYDEYCTIDGEDNSSNDEYDSIRRPAFLVEGKPDFESGPPIDGLEYLRRVRWEAAQIPKVKVAKLNSNKVCTEQTPYMPDIPEIVKCPANLLPSKDWESAFLVDFSDSRQAFSQAESSFSNSFVRSSEDISKQLDCTQQQKNTPTMTLMLSMDAVTRAATLRNRIRKLETSNFLSRDECLWLFALCIAVDTPLTAEMSASLRSLLRKCSNLLAAKSELDDEAAMLSILVTIAGKYFGQSEK